MRQRRRRVPDVKHVSWLPCVGRRVAHREEDIGKPSKRFNPSPIPPFLTPLAFIGQFQAAELLTQPPTSLAIAHLHI
jgi:hypothetical protein